MAKQEVVAAKIGTLITNKGSSIIAALESDADINFITREDMKMMAVFDLDEHWKILANGPTLFLMEEVDGETKVYPPEELEVESANK